MFRILLGFGVDIIDNKEYILLGCDKINITPIKPIPLAGFTFRTGNFTDIHSPLWLKTSVFQYNSMQKLVLICADIIWWDPDLINKCIVLLKENSVWENTQFLFHATHTHFAPNIHKKLSPLLGEYDQEYIDFLVKQVIISCNNALSNLETVSAISYIGETKIPINRRFVKNGRAYMKPNKNGIKDDTLTIIKFLLKDGACKSMIVHMACHPTTSGENIVSAEFISNAIEEFSQDIREKPIISFIQGFSGDVRPPIYSDGEFYRGSLNKESDMLKNQLKNEIKIVLDSKEKALFFHKELYFRKTTTSLLMNTNIDHKTFHSKNKEQSLWHEFFKNNIRPSTILTELYYWKFAKNLELLFSNAEVVTEYGVFAKSLTSKHLLCCGLTNGIIGYIPTSKQIDEKGLESYDSIFFFLLPQQFDPSIEIKYKTLIKNTIENI